MTHGFNNLLVRVGVANPAGSAMVIFADAQNPPFTAPFKRVLLSVDFAQECPPGWPSPPVPPSSGSGAKWSPKTIPSGTTITTFACIANALVAASAGTIA